MQIGKAVLTNVKSIQVDSTEIKIARKKRMELVFGWDNIRGILKEYWG